MKPRVLVAGTTLFMAALLAQSTMLCQGLSLIADRQVSNVYLETLDFENAVQSLAHEKGIPIGFEVLPANKIKRNPVTLRMESGRVRDVLDKLVAFDPRYEWRETDGVIDIAPIAPDPLLDTVVEHFEVRGIVKYAAIDELTRTAELQAAFAKAGVRLHTLMFVSGRALDSDGKRFSLSMRRATARQILNKMLQSTGDPYWVFYRYGDHLQYVGINIG